MFNTHKNNANLITHKNSIRRIQTQVLSHNQSTLNLLS